MRHDLPPQANLAHLKKQAKDLLDGHKRADPEALARIRDAVPAFATMSDDALAKAPFALHDAQSAIAREYGQKSWTELRDTVAARSAGAKAPSDALLRALMPLPFPPEVGALMQEAGGRRTLAASLADAPLPPVLPLVAMRNALFLPRAIGPIHVGRPTTKAAIDFALGRTPPTVAIFAQRSEAEEDETPSAESLHPIGCEALVHARLLDGADHAWVVVEGVRWIALDSIEPGPGGTLVARVKAVAREAGDAGEVGPLADALRALVRELVRGFPDSANLLERVEAAEPDHLADLVVANLPASVEDKASYAAEPRLAQRLRIASGLAGLTPSPM